MGRLRSFLVVLQFSVTTALLIITSVIYFQTQYAKSIGLGFERDNRLILRNLNKTSTTSVRDTFVSEIRKLPEVRSAVLSSEVPTDNKENMTGLQRMNSPESEVKTLNIISIDYGFMEAYGIPLLAGREFSATFGNDTARLPMEDGIVQNISVLLNESAMRHLGFENADKTLGQTLYTPYLFEQPVELTIVGIIPDLQLRSIKYDTLPILYYRSDKRLENLTIAYRTDDLPALVKKLTTLWNNAYPRTPFTYAFLGDLISSQYAEEDRQGTVLLFFTGLAILLATMGLFGLAFFTIVQRTKEVGIRKVLGAEVPGIVKMMLWQFSKPVLIATVIAWPAAWYISQGWLQGFVQRISAFNPYIFAGATLAALAIAWLTVAGHTLKAARTKPANALRHE